MIIHSLTQATGGWAIGGSVHYSYHYGKAYIWEQDYDSLGGLLKGRFPETKCGALYINTLEWESRKETESNKYILSERCGQLMSLAEFVDRYSNGIAIGELRVKREMPSEEAQVGMFNEWKNQGLIDDVRYKDVTLYDWGNILNFIILALFIPALITSVVWSIFRVIGLIVRRIKERRKKIKTS